MNEHSILWIQRGLIIDPANRRHEVGDIFAINGKIVSSLTDEQKKLAQIIQAENWVVCPGLIDIHVHFREPGQTHKETIKTGSQAAAAGGFTTVVCMPNTIPSVDNVGTLQQMQNIIQRDAVIHVLITGTITQGREGQSLAPIGSLKQAGAIAITDDGECVQSHELMRHALEYAHMFDLVIMDHCQESTLTQRAVMHEGYWSLKLGLTGWPSSAEDIIVARNIILAQQTGAHVHMQHISSAESVEMIRIAKAKGISVTAEVTPHHLTFTDRMLSGYNTHFKMNPPLRCERHREALIQGLLDNTIDIIATDHAPHTNYEKDVEFDYAPFGIVGLETSLAASLEVLYHSKRCDFSQIISKMSDQPARILKLKKGTLSEGADADITIFDPSESWKFDARQSFSLSSNSPWHDSTLRGKVKYTIVDGKIVFDGSRIVV